MFYKRIIDPSAYFILWQIGVVGDLSYGIEVTGAKYRKLLLELLYEHYPADHQVILYEAATLPIKEIRADYIPLSQIVEVELKDYTTLVIPPSQPMTKNIELIKKIRQL